MKVKLQQSNFLWLDGVRARQRISTRLLVKSQIHCFLFAVLDAMKLPVSTSPCGRLVFFAALCLPCCKSPRSTTLSRAVKTADWNGKVARHRTNSEAR